MIIKAKSSYDAPAGARYLNVFSASSAFTISSKSEGLTETTVKSGFSYDLESIGVVTFHNRSDTDLHVEFEISSLRIITGSNAGVDIVNQPVIQRIVEPIAVTAQATVENGTVHVISGKQFTDSTDVTLGAQAKVKLLSENPDRKAALIQVISDTRTSVRIGSSSVGASRGLFASGSLTNPAIIPIESGAEIYAYNVDASNPAKFAIVEVLK